MKKANNMKSLKDKDKFPPPRSDHQTVNLFWPECLHSWAVKEEVVQIFCIGSTEKTLAQIT